MSQNSVGYFVRLADFDSDAAIFEIWVAFYVYADDAEARGSIKGRMN
ncbi:MULTISPECIES: hypothetical protein [unclassified Nostoc]|nr:MULTISPECIES: hypothetical protein [unclassified Nostoc]MDM9580653.1 hypothetical protein [Nostoc sp. GT001]MDZ7945846.1 hypothetical protein [Nostoc sp. EfeVER01]MDZ7990611.1 hypothetical protein [Nostoc sp. EspVER01]